MWGGGALVGCGGLWWCAADCAFAACEVHGRDGLLLWCGGLVWFSGGGGG